MTDGPGTTGDPIAGAAGPANTATPGTRIADAREPAPERVWLMGLGNMVYGYAYAVVLVTVPQLLAARGMPEPRIADLTALAMAASLATFVLAPILDTWVSRRRWAVGLALASAVLVLLVLVLPAKSVVFTPALLALVLAASLYNSAIGGWLGASLNKSADETIGAWFNIGNASGFGIGAQIQFWLIGHLPAPFGALAVTGILVGFMAMLLALPPPDAGRARMRESFGRLGRDVAHLVRQPAVLRIVVLFLLPCAAFTLTNSFGGIGGDFHASPALVDASTGSGAVLVGIVAALLMKPLVSRAPAPLVYLAVGGIGAAFTLALLPLPHAPAVFVLAVLGENIFQTAAQVTQNAIMFRSIAQDSPLASSQFGLLQTASVVPYSYMQALDGHGYRLAGGVAGSFLMDAGVSLAACLLMVLPVLHWMRRGQLGGPAPDATLRS